ncbi:hypothetical protein [Candidatus Enterovibrio escicola]|uniref:Mobile element protein n=1 Tax=Candidatus Enterovibrio escicola TaxID=1927127 RepID=A0A2A5T3M5_9GAMM|nr:hypothetical protein [Candidatus Enterovibrio escacola]PCS22752.1 hypothetical protein BTN49_1716 [Candidatus Enterovibrio escacola]
MASKLAADITAATIYLLIPDKKHVHTITADNGRGFSYPQKIAKALDVEI